MATIFILDALRNPIIALIYSIILNSVIRILMLSILFIWMDIKVSTKKTILCSFCGMLLGILPIIITNFAVADPVAARIIIYQWFIYDTPIFSLFYYFVIKRTLRFSPTRAGIVLYYQLLINHAITTFYLFLNDVFCKIFNVRTASDGFYPPDYLSFILILGVWYLIWAGMKNHLRNSRKHLIIPPSYADKNGRRNFIKTFLVLCVLYLATVIFRGCWFSQSENPITLITAFIYALLIIGVLFYIINRTLKLRLQLMDWEMQATGTYISSLLHINQEFRSLKHDFNNMLQGYGGYIALKDYEGLQNYHNQLCDITEQAGDFLSIIEILRSRIAVYSLLEAKAQKAKKSEVIFSIQVVCEVTDIVINDLDLCRVLGIVIDNAIEEAENSSQKQVNLSFKRKDTNTILFVISNATNHDVDTERIFDTGYTTKRNHTGVGLPQVMHILNSYEHCSFRTHYHDKQFSMFLILHAPRKVS